MLQVLVTTFHQLDTREVKVRNFMQALAEAAEATSTKPSISAHQDFQRRQVKMSPEEDT